MDKPIALVVGVGAEQGIGAAVCRRFAAEGHRVVVVGRTAERVHAAVTTISAHGGEAEAIVADATKEEDVLRLFDSTFPSATSRSATDVVVFNAGGNKPIDFRETTALEFEQFWRAACFSGFLVGREAARRLAPLGRGTVIFTGASASLRGKPNYAHFAAAKSGLRMVAQSMAREFGPLGIHVAHVVIDGGVHGERLLSRLPQLVDKRGPDGLLDTDAIARTYYEIHRQHRSAWSHEVDLRPYGESF